MNVIFKWGRAGVVSVICLFLSCSVYGVGTGKIFIPMDSTGQNDHLKAYGVAYAALKQGLPVDWLLNYKGGSFAITYDKGIETICHDRGVTFVKMTDDEYAKVAKRVSSSEHSGAVVKLEKAPKIAVYTPSNKEPWDDAVTLALTYAEIPYYKIFAEDVLSGGLDNYEWLHVFHEDFTGQFGKFWFGFQYLPWYQNDVKTEDSIAHKNGFNKVAQMQLAVVQKIKDFIQKGGNVFAMCTATETFDIALASAGVDICQTPYDGDPADPEAQQKLKFGNCLAFKNFYLSFDSMVFSHSSIDNNVSIRMLPESLDYFTLHKFNAKINPIPALLTQNHTKVIKGFWGQTTAFRMQTLKPDVIVLADCQLVNEAKFIHGEFGKGTWTFYGGHDPEDYKHNVGAPPTDLSKHNHSPGYRLILNNVLFNAAKSKTTQTVVSNDTATAQRSEPESTDLVVSRVELSPDPSNNELIISYPQATTTGDAKNKVNNFIIQSVVFINAAGNKVIDQKFNAAKVSIPLADMPPGVYLIKVNGVYAGRIVKE